MATRTASSRANKRKLAIAAFAAELARIDALPAAALLLHPDRVLSVHRRLLDVDEKRRRPPVVRAFTLVLALDHYLLSAGNGCARFLTLPRAEIASTVDALAEMRAPELKLLKRAIALLPGGGLARTEAAHRAALAQLNKRSALKAIESTYRARAKWPAPSRALTAYLDEHLDEILAFIARALRSK